MIAHKRFLVLMMLLVILPAHAQEAGQADGAVKPDQRQRIERLLEVTGALNIAKMMSAAVTRQMIGAIKQARPDIPPEGLDIVADEVNSVISEAMIAQGGFVDLIVPIYAKHFTADELDALIAFYETPVGRKTVEVMPQVTREAMQIGQRWGQSLGPTIVERLKARFKEQGIEL